MTSLIDWEPRQRKRTHGKSGVSAKIFSTILRRLLCLDNCAMIIVTNYDHGKTVWKERAEWSQFAKTSNS